MDLLNFCEIRVGKPPAHESVGSLVGGRGSPCTRSPVLEREREEWRLRSEGGAPGSARGCARARRVGYVTSHARSRTGCPVFGIFQIIKKHVNAALGPMAGLRCGGRKACSTSRRPVGTSPAGAPREDRAERVGTSWGQAHRRAVFSQKAGRMPHSRHCQVPALGKPLPGKRAMLAHTQSRAPNSPVSFHRLNTCSRQSCRQFREKAGV